MPPLALASLLHRSLPWLSTPGRAVVNWLVCFNGRVGSTDALVQRLGLANRYALSRLLRGEGLPPFEELSGWVCVLFWMLRADATGSTLRGLARDADIGVASGYRLVRRVTGMRWSALRRAGTAHVVQLFVTRCTPSPATRASRGPVPTHEAAAALPAAELGRPVDTRPMVPLRVPLRGGPCDIAFHPAGWAYVSRVDAAAVDRLALSTGSVTGSTPIGAAPCCLAVDGPGQRAYVSVHYDDEIAVIDTARHARVGTLRLPGDPLPVRLSPTGRTLYVTTNEDRLYAVAIPSGRIVASLSLPATSHHLAVHPSGGRLYVATRTAGSVLEIDTARHQLIRTFSPGGWTQGLTVSPDGSTLYVANEKHGVDVIRLASGQLVGTIPLDGGPCELALSPDQRRLFVGLVHGGKIAVVDCASFTVAALLDVGGEPRGMAFDPRGQRVAIANHAGWVDVLPAGPSALSTVPGSPSQQAAPAASA